MARIALMSMTQQLQHITQSRGLKISLLQFQGALKGKQALEACRFYQLAGRLDCIDAFALNREGGPSNEWSC